ncbi:MAG: hypothetical protein LC799_27175 [Actinobacteria bacterium]|nr:hypothetical protein [Actinomycetota bacterium]
MEATRDEAEAMLAQAGGAQRRVQARSPKEHVPFFIWGTFKAVVIPGFDLFDKNVWGWVTMSLAVVGFIATAGYFVTRSRHVRVSERSPWWTWPALTVWMCICGAIAVGLDGALSFSYVLGGWLSSIPLFVWGYRLREVS